MGLAFYQNYRGGGGGGGALILACTVKNKCEGGPAPVLTFIWLGGPVKIKKERIFSQQEEQFLKSTRLHI